MTTYNLTELKQKAEYINFKSLLNCYCREFNNWSRYGGIPKHDPALADYIQSTGKLLFLRFDFSEVGIEVFAPLQYFSESGVHAFYYPIVERDLETNEITAITPQRFIEIVALYAKTGYPGVDATITNNRLENSIANLAAYLADFQENNRVVNSVKLSFIESEQSLILGHSVHPLPKSREGFTEAELKKYSPETAEAFHLHYFLIHPEQVIEKSTEAVLTTDQLKKDILDSGNDAVIAIVEQHPDWKVVPVHPWEALYLLNLPEVKEMQSENLLLSLGEFGLEFTATSSVRTVYNAESEWMYKFSLHVKITNSYRVNYPHELNRGYDASRLLKTGWGKEIEKDFPEIQLITDPAFIMVTYKGNVIDGFSTSIRQNPFKAENAAKNVGLVASLCQDGVLDQASRMFNVINGAAQIQQKPVKEVVKKWFSQYLNITIRPLVGIFNKYGLGCEFHQQNMLVELDETLFPSKLYFRDNQGYFFRKGMVEQLEKVIPEFGKESRSFIAEPRIINFWGYYLLVNHLLGVINALSKNGLAQENELISMLYQSLKNEETTDATGLINHLLNSPELTIKGNLLTNLNNMDEASAPRENPAVYKAYPNPLHQHFFSEKLLNPKGKEVVFSRFFPKEDVEITIRPFDLDRDLDLVFEWFHRDHAKKIWQMDWPIQKLETYYRTMLAGGAAHSYIGEANGIPTFNIEVYWATRDVVGNYYEVLPDDYGTHQFIAPVDPKLKYASPSTQSMLDFVFSEPLVGKMVGEGSVDSLASMMNKAHVGFKIQKVIELPNKRANLNFCYREWYWEKFPEAQNFKADEVSLINTKH